MNVFLNQLCSSGNSRKQYAALIVIFFSIINSAYAQVDASFFPTKYNICSGTSVSLINTSTGANHFEWYFEGQFYSSARDTTAVLYEPCYELFEIKLIACDTSTSSCDSSRIFVEVFDSCFFHWTADIIQCAGDTVYLQGSPEAIQTQWSIFPLHAYLSGCDTCASISFIIQNNGVLVDEHSFYDGGCSEITSFHYSCLQNEIQEENTEFTIYPNPFNDIIHIRNRNESFVERIEIFNALGAYCGTRFPKFDKVEVSDLNKGLYVFRLVYRSGEGRVSGKWIGIKE